MIPPNPMPHILILGGTADARQLAALIQDRLGAHVRLTTSLAGRTKRPAALAGDLRVGGFGGVSGLVDYLAAEHVTLMIDATHPFAATISRHAVEAAREVGIPRLMIVRPQWQLPVALDVVRVSDMEAAAIALRTSGARRVLLTTGIQNLDVFARLPDIWFLIRQIEDHEKPLPLAHANTVIQKPPFTLEGERALMAEHEIDTVVSKESGGSATEAKLRAAAELGIRVVLIERPPMPMGENASSPEDALIWIEARLSA